LHGSDEEPCGGRCDGLFEVLGEAAVAVQPGEGSFDDPATRQDFEALGAVGSLDDLDRPLADWPQCVPEFVPRIAAIGEQVAQPGKSADDPGEHQRRSVAVLDVGGVDHGVDQISLGIGEDVALASLDLLACVITPRPAGFRGFYALAIDDASAGRGLAAVRLARGHEQIVVQRLPQAVVAPQIEPAPHRRNRREARWQHPPRQAPAQQVEDRLDNPPHLPLARTADMRGWREKRFQNRPFGIGQIAWQSQSRAGMMRASGIGPHR